MGSVQCPRCAARTRIVVSLHPPVSFPSPRPVPCSTGEARGRPRSAAQAVVHCAQCGASLHIANHPGPTIRVRLPAPAVPVPAAVQSTTMDVEECESLLQYIDDDDNNNTAITNTDDAKQEDDDRAPLHSSTDRRRLREYPSWVPPQPPRRSRARSAPPSGLAETWPPSRHHKPPQQDEPDSDDSESESDHSEDDTRHDAEEARKRKQSIRERLQRGVISTMRKGKEKATRFPNPKKPLPKEQEQPTHQKAEELSKEEKNWRDVGGCWDEEQDAFEMYVRAQFKEGGETSKHALFRLLSNMAEVIGEGVGSKAGDALKGLSLGTNRSLKALRELREVKNQFHEIFFRLHPIIDKLITACKNIAGTSYKEEGHLGYCVRTALRLYKLLCGILEDVYEESLKRNIINKMKGRNEGRLRLLSLMFEDLRFNFITSLILDIHARVVRWDNQGIQSPSEEEAGVQPAEDYVDYDVEVDSGAHIFSSPQSSSSDLPGEREGGDETAE